MLRSIEMSEGLKETAADAVMSCGRQKKVKYHLPEETIDEMLREAEDDDRLRRIGFIKNLYQGDIVSEAADRAGRSPPTGGRWVEAWNDGGFAEKGQPRSSRITIPITRLIARERSSRTGTVPIPQGYSSIKIINFMPMTGLTLRMSQRIMLNAIGSDNKINVDGKEQRACANLDDKDGAVAIPDTADMDEQAAIAAAIRTYLERAT